MAKAKRRAAKTEADRNDRGFKWDRWFTQMGVWAETMQQVGGLMELAGKIEQGRARPMDWLAIAIFRLGGASGAAQKLGVSRQTIYTWAAEGIGKVSFEKICALSELTEVPLEYLKKRCGPFPGPFVLPNPNEAAQAKK